MNTLDSKLPTPEEAAIAKASSQELSAFIETKVDTQLLFITDADGIAHVVNLPVSSTVTQFSNIFGPVRRVSSEMVQANP